MSGELKSGCGTGRTIYWLAVSTNKVLNTVTLALDSAPLTTYGNYDITGTEIGTTGVYVGNFPTGAPAGTYDIFPYEAVSGTPTQGDPFAAGAFTLTWNGYTSTDALGTDVDSTVALVTLTDAKQYLKVTTSNDDAILATLINSVSAWIQGYLKRNLVSKTYTEYYSGDGSNELILRNTPIVSITSIYVDSLRAWASDNLVDSTDYIIKKGSGIVQAFNLLYGWTCGESNIKITYVAGYSIGITGGDGTLPHDIRLAVKRLLDLHYRMGYSQRKLDTQSESIGGMNTQFKDEDIPKDIKSMLDGYKSFIPAPQYEYAD
jgi:uncharacterized phiE125 gp8 family phage protein